MKHWKILFGLWSAQGFIVLCWLLFIPASTERAVAFGFSSARLALLFIAFLVTGSSILLLSKSYKQTSSQSKFNLDQHTAFWDVLYLLAFLTSLVAPLFIVTLGSLKENPHYPVYAVRLLPLFAWFGISGLELALLVAWHRYRETVKIIDPFRPLWKKIFFLFLTLVLVGVLAALTKAGFTPDKNLGSPATPLFEWQILLILFIISIFAFLPHIDFVLNDKWIALGIYVFTVILWLSQPINPAYTATPPRAPVFEIFPFSDALIYAQSAQSALAGNGFLWPEVPARPFYIGFLTWLHLLGGQNYNNVIVLQTLVLSAFPAVLYLIGKEFGGRPLGLGISLLAILRDINANGITLIAGNLTYSKLLLSELPAAFLISLVTLLSIRWMRLTKQTLWRPFLIGGILGVTALIRTQSIILLAVIIPIAFFVISNRKQWLIGSAFLVLGVAMTFTPWLIRNYIATGGFVIDSPLSQTVTMARRWSGYTGEEILSRIPGESDAQYSSRATKTAIEAFKTNYTFIFQTAANHFVNNEITSLLAFPARDEILSPAELIFPQHEFWRTPLSKNQLLPFAFYLLLFSVGTIVAWQRYRLVGLLPLALHLTYNLWTSLFFSSGQRFVFPLDWGVYLYQFFGLLVLGSVFLSFVSKARNNVSDWIRTLFTPDPVAHEFDVLSRRRFISSLVLVLFLGAFLPVTESIFPQRYPPKPQEEIIRQIGLPKENEEIAIYGRAIYPRYYNAGDGEPGTAKLGYGRSEEARLVFFLIGPKSMLVIFDLKDAPGFFPHASDVFMIGTQMDGYFAPRVVKVIKDGRSELYINK